MSEKITELEQLLKNMQATIETQDIPEAELRLLQQNWLAVKTDDSEEYQLKALAKVVSESQTLIGKGYDAALQGSKLDAAHYPGAGRTLHKASGLVPEVHIEYVKYIAEKIKEKLEKKDGRKKKPGNRH